MNAIAQTFVTAFGAVAAAAAIGIGLADHAAEPSGQVTRLERVVVVGQRTAEPQVAQLPRVVVVVQRRAPHDVVIAQAESSRPL